MSEHRYSGDKSRMFWRRLAKLKHGEKKEELYALAVMLQNIESLVLKHLERVEGKAKP